MIFPCPNPPVDCPNSDNAPFINNSSEAPDQFTFLGEAFGPGPGVVPPLGWAWGPLEAYSTCESTISQDDANACASAAALKGTKPFWVPPADQKPLPPNPPNPETFGNTAQQGMATCPDGTQFILDVPKNMFFAGTVSAANEAAVDYGKQQAILHLLCLSDLPSPVCAIAALNFQIFASSNFLAPPGANQWALLSGDSSLPPGVAFTGANTGPAILSGNPTTPGDYLFVIGITLPNGDSTAKEYTMTVAGLLNGNSLPEATPGKVYTASLVTLGFSNPVFSTDDDLPDGLSMDTSGNITGTPENDAETSTINLTITDGVTGFTCGAQATVTIKMGLNFNQLVWTASVAPPGCIEAASGTWQKNNFQTQVPPFTGSYGDADCTGSLLDVSGSVNYSGPAVNCNLALTIVRIGNNPNPQGFGRLIVITVQDQDSNIYLSIASLSGQVPNPSGTYNYPFIIPALNGATLTFTMHGFTNDGGAASYNMSGVLTPAT